MKQITKVLNKDAVIPELKYVVFTGNHAVVWNGIVGVRYKLSKSAGLLAQLVRSHGPFAILDGLKFIQIVSTLEKVSRIDIKDSQLVLVSAAGKATVKIPVVDELPDNIPHNEINWNIDSKPVKIEGLWYDAQDIITRDGVALWGDVVGVYETPEYKAAFDYGVLLYQSKQRKRFDRGKRKRSDDDTLVFCPYYLLDLGLTGMQDIVTDETGLVIRGQEMEYFTHVYPSTHVLNTMLDSRTEALQSTPHNVTLDFSAGVWKRAKVFNRLVVNLVIHKGNISLVSDNWDEHIGITDAPDNVFVTRVSLLERWTLNTLGHKIYVGEDGWYLYGTTRKGSEFYGNLTAVATPNTNEDDEYTIPGEEDVGDEEAGSLFDL